MEHILEITGLNKSYPGFSLQDISFALPDGCITGFIGKNGAGKTTTLKSILGLVPKISGTIKWFGMDLSSNEKEIKERIGIVLDDGGFYDELTLSEMKSIIASAYKSWSNDDYNMYLARFSLNPKQKISILSKGMRMKYALALALSHKAEFLIMDEPTSGLDPLIRNQLLEILKEFMDNGGHGVFFSTHITSDLDKIADTLIMIDEGHIVFQEEKDNLLDRYRIVKGDVADLCPDTEKLLMNIDKTPFGFTAITKYADDLQKAHARLHARTAVHRRYHAQQYQRRELNVTSISEKRVSNRKEICTAHGCSLYPISNIFAMAYAGIRRNIRIWISDCVLDFDAFAICFSKRNAISKSIHITVCIAIFKEKHCAVQIYFLHRDLFLLLFDFWNRISFVSNTSKRRLQNPDCAIPACVTVFKYLPANPI